MPAEFPDVLIVGAGPAGCEAAWTCARAGLQVLLVTTSLDTLYWPVTGSAELTGAPDSLAQAIGTALGNPAQPVRARDLHRLAKEQLESLPGIHLLQSSVSGLVTDSGSNDSTCRGVTTWEGPRHFARLTVLCVGSFLQARLESGLLRENAGRPGEMAYDDLYLDLLERGFDFEAVTASAAPVDGPPFAVTSRKFGPAEFAGPQSFSLRRVGNLFAAGYCASGYLTFAEAAAQGAVLGSQLSADRFG